MTARKARARAKQKQIPCGNGRQEKQGQRPKQKQIPCGNGRQEKQ
jgi:hypothetical protein